MIDIVGRVRWIRDKVNQLFALVNAIFTLTETGGNITTDGNEQDVYRIETPLGNFEPRVVQIDFTNNTAADSIRIRVYYRINPTGNLIKKDEFLVTGAQDPALINVELEPNRYGIRVSMQRLAGGALSYDWCAFTRL